MEAKEIAEQLLEEVPRNLLYLNKVQNGIEQLAQAYLKLLEEREGMVLVPVEPTEEMAADGGMIAFQVREQGKDFKSDFELATLIYKAMIAATEDKE